MIFILLDRQDVLLKISATTYFSLLSHFLRKIIHSFFFLLKAQRVVTKMLSELLLDYQNHGDSIDIYVMIQDKSKYKHLINQNFEWTVF
jgi:hypothetical protein